MTELPAGTVTFLFTDIEGSTRLLNELGERYADVLTDHRRLLRDAAAAQRALAAHPWPGETELRVRMGIHTGEPLLAEDHYVGIDVHRGARIAASALGGQVLVSARTP